MSENSEKRNWFAFDSEFREDAPRDDELGVYSIQAATLSEQFYANRPELWWRWLKDWTEQRKSEGDNHIVMFGFVAIVDVGAFDTWAINHVNPPIDFKKSFNKLGVQDRWFFQLFGMEFKILDLAPLAKTMSMMHLENVGDFLTKYRKLEHPNNLNDHSKCFHKLNECPHGDPSHMMVDPDSDSKKLFPWKCPLYALRDSLITLEFAKYLFEQGLNPETIGTPGQLAAAWFAMPSRNKWNGHSNGYEVTVLEKNLRFHGIFAGRNECFRNGGPYKASYVDRTSLYPESMLRSKAVMIRDTEHCSIDDIDMKPSWTGDGYGWGMFSTLQCDDPVWSFPKRQENVIYAVGTFTSDLGILRATDDLVAGETKIVEDPIWVCRPVFAPIGSTEETIQNKLEELFDQRVKEQLPFEKKGLLKGAMNALSGKYGASQPQASATTNYLTYSALLARSHLLMADWCRWAMKTHDAKLYGFDTDAGVISLPLEESGTRDGIPYKFSVQEKMKHKMNGNMIYYRAKQYVMECEDGALVSAQHGWRYEWKKFEKLGGRMMPHAVPLADDSDPDFEGDSVDVIQETKKTMDTVTKAVKMLRWGGWIDKKKKLTDYDLTSLLWADRKRNRGDFNKEPWHYDSYGLAKSGRWIDSKPWEFEAWSSYGYHIMHTKREPLFKKGKKGTIEAISKLYTDSSQLANLPIGFEDRHLDKLVKQVLKARRHGH